MKKVTQKASSPQKALGRPKDLGKHAAILLAAKAQFMRHGFDRASMDAIALEAGVSKLTIYTHFGSKDELFKAMIVEKCQEFKLNHGYEQLLALPLKDALMQIGLRFTQLMYEKEVIALNRIIISESAEKPKISQLLYEAGPKPSAAALADFLRWHHHKRHLQLPQIEAATQHFFSLLKGERHFTVMMNIQKPPTEKERRAHVADCVALFMRAYAPIKKVLPASAKKSDRSKR
ncbi:MAG: TetR/AcrR family transcriptional regulator [Rickettsiales bacterium]|nr:TetR/AcrR family transcriptional regulator [Rickettsiales bacterium]